MDLDLIYFTEFFLCGLSLLELESFIVFLWHFDGVRQQLMLDDEFSTQLTLFWLNALGLLKFLTSVLLLVIGHHTWTSKLAKKYSDPVPWSIFKMFCDWSIVELFLFVNQLFRWKSSILWFTASISYCYLGKSEDQWTPSRSKKVQRRKKISFRDRDWLG